MRSMKRNVRIFALLLCAALLLPGCGKKECPAAAPSGVTPASAQAASSKTAGSRQTAGSEAQSGASSEKVGTVPQGGMVKTIRTDSQSFNEKFKKNPIDQDYVSEMKKALSNVDMAKVSDKYAGIWEKEISNAYGKLKNALAADSTMKWKQIETGQKTWETGKDAALKKIGDDAAAAGGSLAQVEASSGAMDYYRSRAAELYRQLFDYDKNYAYQFKK